MSKESREVEGFITVNNFTKFKEKIEKKLSNPDVKQTNYEDLQTHPIDLDSAGPKIKIKVKQEKGKFEYIVKQEDLVQAKVDLSDGLKKLDSLKIKNTSNLNIDDKTVSHSPELLPKKRNILGRIKDYITSQPSYQYTVNNKLDTALSVGMITGGATLIAIGALTVAPIIVSVIYTGPVAIAGAGAAVGVISTGAYSMYMGAKKFNDSKNQYKKDHPELFTKKNVNQKSGAEPVKEQTKEIKKEVQPATPTLKIQVAKEANNIAAKAQPHVMSESIGTEKNNLPKPSPALTTPNQEQKGNHHNKAARKF